jgi:hypothetical protein
MEKNLFNYLTIRIDSVVKIIFMVLYKKTKIHIRKKICTSSIGQSNNNTYI